MISDRLFVVSFIADIHFGALKTELLYEQLQECFIKKIQNKKIDMIVFGGDIFHSVITMNYSTSHYVLLFMERLIDLCVENGIKYVRIIQGTMSHDNNQLNNFHIFENRTDVDVKIIMTIREEKLIEGLKILYVPEEYVLNPDEYYSEYFNMYKYYDFIFGHGMFKEVSFIAKNQESEVSMSKAPVFDSKIFINACKGPIYFGHIHTKVTIKKHIHYPGSFSRFKFGEEDPKGWYLCVYDKDSNKYIHNFVENIKAQTYNTILVNIVEEVKPEILTSLIDTALETDDYIKLKLVIKENIECSYLISYLNDKYQKNSAVKIEVKNEYEFRNDVLKDTKAEEICKEYEFLFDNSYTHEEKIQKFIKVKHNRDIPIDIIKDQLNLL